MKRYIALLPVLLLFLIGCQEDMKGPLVKDDTPPRQVTNITVENLPGAAKITYSLPNDDDLLYVIANYITGNGAEKQAKSSVFKNYILIEGFAEEKEYNISLRTVDKSENYSDPVAVTVRPLEAHIHEVRRTLDAETTWGGAKISMYNELQKEYVIHTLLEDSITGEWYEFDRAYTAAVEREHYVRGLPAVETNFAFYISDEWSNSSDTLFKTFAPLYEVMFDIDLFKVHELPDDTTNPRYNDLTTIWDPNRSYFFQESATPGIKVPNWFTIDVGRKYIFGRFKLNQVRHHNTWRFGSCSPRLFEIWVTNNPSTNWNDWILLAELESIKPSGLPVGEFTEEDLAVNAAGEEYEFPILEEGYRYFRFVTKETWGAVPYMCAHTFTFWGQPYDN